MRRQALKTPVSQDVCIFCSTRMQVASARASLRTERRFFRSTPAVQRPLSEAVAQRVDEDDQGSSQGWRSDTSSRQSGGGSSNNTLARVQDKSRFGNTHTKETPQRPLFRRHVLSPDRNLVHDPATGQDRKPPQSLPPRQQPRGGGWARTSVTSDLTLEEQALRDILRKEGAPSPVSIRQHLVHFDQRKQVHVKRYHVEPSEPSETDGLIRRHFVGKPNDDPAPTRIEQADWDCPECGIFNYGINTACRKCRTSRSVPEEKRQVSWMCTSCEQLNAEQYEQCWNCRSERVTRDQQDEASLARGWEHVRRPGSAPIEPSAPPDSPAQAEHPRDLQSLARARQIEREKLMRLEETKDGRFVGLRAQQQPRVDDYPERTLAEPFPVPTVRDNPEFANLADDTRSRHVSGREQRQSQYEAQPETDWRSVSQRESQYDFPRVARGFESTSIPSARGRHYARRNKKVYTGYDEAEEDEEGRAVRRMERKEQRKKSKAAHKTAAPPTPIYLPEFISVSNLAGVLRVRVEDFISKMQELGFEETNNDHVLDAETAGLVAAEFNFEPIVERTEDRDLHPLPPAEDKSQLPARPPVVTIMGHVDHGKTTLLDYLRKSSVAASEHGGITQHIGAFSVPMPGGRLVTFLDTPGHEAFLSMRQRGANVTDIVILVVAADDSVKPQTIEAIKHAQVAKVPMIVVVNKIDKEDSNVERVKQDLSRYSVEIEDYGGDTQVVCVSGKTGQGMEELEDAAVALADILDMRAEVDGQAEGWVLEATTKKAGRVATVLVRRGTIRPGDVIVAGTSWARVRSLRNEAGAMVDFAGPGTPVEIDGWREQPMAGDEVIQAPDEQKAKDVVEYRLEASERTKMAADIEAVNEARRLEQEKREQLEKATKLATANPNAAIAPQPSYTSTTPTFQEVFFVVKGDVSGSVEAVTNSVSSLGNSEVRPHILRSGVGPVAEFDVDHAAVAKGHIINFNTAIDGHIRQLAEEKNVGIIDQSIIYRLVDDVKAKLSEKLPPTVTQKVLGEAEIGQVFEINIKGRVTLPVAGCRVRNGVISRTAKVRVLRDVLRDKPDVAYDGTLSSLKNVKKDVAEMRKGTECGMGFENWTDFRVGDQVQAYEEIVEKRTL
ncbi:hypothetical protein OEA41_004594 [Lepraria neglecta]|uniref:Translation initiation factor IF-2, mitochondrial n=1 Tax=Lepraria neglecta TaxID=209136 RepID=A0AAE0DIE2_9LECA|nr:hypothetical protein OEA41_004594 [Lepraria neglecta]